MADSGESLVLVALSIGEVVLLRRALTRLESKPDGGDDDVRSRCHRLLDRLPKLKEGPQTENERPG